MSCKFKDIFGKPNMGAHKWHVGPFAVVDTLLTIVLAIIIFQFLKVNFLIIFALVFIVGELAHIAFGVQTAFLTFLKTKKYFKIIITSCLVKFFIFLS